MGSDHSCEPVQNLAEIGEIRDSHHCFSCATQQISDIPGYWESLMGVHDMLGSFPQPSDIAEVSEIVYHMLHN